VHPGDIAQRIDPRGKQHILQLTPSASCKPISGKLDNGGFTLVIIGLVAQFLGIFQADPVNQHVPQIISGKIVVLVRMQARVSLPCDGYHLLRTISITLGYHQSLRIHRYDSGPRVDRWVCV